jgi:4-hydroxyacetophenone monooxygenase
MATLAEKSTAHSGEADWQNRSLPMADTPELREALGEANVQTLLMVYVHLTHDEAMLDVFRNYIKPPYATPGTEFPEEYLEELRGKLLAVLTTPGAARQEDPSDALMQKMMSVGVGETVEDEFLPLVLEQSGFRIAQPRKEIPTRKAPSGQKVLVIGAGLTGLVASVKLEEAGYDHIVIEKNPEVGGTWYENRYPGVGVDTPSHFYSYSFEITPEWNHYHPHGADMQEYLLYVADKYELRKNIRFKTMVTKLVYDDAAAMWDVTVRNADGSEEVLRVNAVINAHGPVNRWKWPDVPGLDAFQGIKMHTATWDPATDIKGKRVAVIGTGASAAQLVPAIASDVGQLTVFMRSKHWVIYNPEIMTEVTPGMKFALRHIPHFREWFRFRVYWFAADGLFPNVMKDPEWKDETGMSVSAINEGMRQYALAHLNAKFADRPDLKEKLTPDFPIFSKRIIMDGGWFDALKRDHVTLETGKIERITENGIRMTDGTEYEIDVLICATGFDVANMLGKLTVIGREGRNLREEWGIDDPRSYLGVTIPGYPNYFLTVGPNSAPNHAAGQNLISEVQVNYIIECLDWANAEGKKAIEPKQEVFESWNEMIQARMQEMIWTHPKANSYYNNSKGRVYLSWPYRLVDYWNEMRGPKKDHFILN